MCSFHGHGGEIHVQKRHQTPDNKSSLEFPAWTFCSEKQEALTFAPFLCHSCVIVGFNPLFILTLFVSHPRETCQKTLLKMARSRKGKVTTKYTMMAGIYYFNISIVRSSWIHPVTSWNAVVVQRADAAWMNKQTLLSTGAGLQGVCAVIFEHFKRPNNKTETQNGLKLYKTCTTRPPSRSVLFCPASEDGLSQCWTTWRRTLVLFSYTEQRLQSWHLKINK